MKEKIKKIISDNYDTLEKNIKKETDRKLNALMQETNIDFEEELIYKLKSSIEKEIREYFYDKIEYKVIIEELYPEHMKQEALDGLPGWIVKL